MSVFELEGFGGKIYLKGEGLSSVVLNSLSEEIARLEQKFSRFILDSELNKLNKKIDQWVSVDEEFLSLLKLAKDLEVQTQACFNIATKGLLESWGYDADYNLNQSYDFEFSGKSFELDLEKSEVWLHNEIDFGSLGKGYFLDQAKLILENSGLDGFMINAGGDLVVGNYPQKIYFEDPRNVKKVIGEAEVENLFMASSSPLRRRWKDKHHLIDGNKNKPAETMSAVYLQSSVSGVWVDAMSTALFVLGFERAKKLVLSEAGIEAMLIGENGEVWRSDGFVGGLY